jgi:myo-inositol-1(or 4)-monophosphatase
MTATEFDTDLLTGMADVARQATELFAALPPPEPFDGWDRFRAVFDKLDTAVTRLLRSRLEELRPGTPWLDELTAEVPYWLVDGVDGAVQYLQGLPHWSVSISLLRDGRTVLAALWHGCTRRGWARARSSTAGSSHHRPRPCWGSVSWR